MSEQEWIAPWVEPSEECDPAGYAWLVREYRLRVLPHWRWTFVSRRHVRRELERAGAVIHILPKPRSPGPALIDQLFFALRYDGVSVGICRALFAVAADETADQLTERIREAPTSQYARRAWLLFEELTGRRLANEDATRGNYVKLADPKVHVTGPVVRYRRQRVDVNLLGSIQLSPVIRWTPDLREVSGALLRTRIDSLVATYDDDVVRRAISYLYTRETLASFEIEHERPARTRAERFVALLREAPSIERLNETTLTRLQNALVDPRFTDEGWRSDQNYVGEAIDVVRQRIHFVSPTPQSLPELMERFLELANSIGETDPVLWATVISFVFVLFHPFTDGNGRIHRWLLHWVLSRNGVTPPDAVIPVSAVMLLRRREYDQALETFSVPLMKLVSYELDHEGRLTVTSDTDDLYRHPDLTKMAEALWRWLNEAVERELPSQLQFLVGLDGARLAIQDIVDMPDRLVVLFIQVCRANGGILSSTKRKRHFAMLTDAEVERMQDAVHEHFERAARLGQPPEQVESNQ